MGLHSLTYPEGWCTSQNVTIAAAAGPPCVYHRIIMMKHLTTLYIHPFRDDFLCILRWLSSTVNDDTPLKKKKRLVFHIFFSPFIWHTPLCLTLTQSSHIAKSLPCTLKTWGRDVIIIVIFSFFSLYFLTEHQFRSDSRSMNDIQQVYFNLFYFFFDKTKQK